MAQSVREDFLQQNAFEDGDSYTSLQKQYALVSLILYFRDRALEAVKAGADIEKISVLPVRERIGRAKSAEDYEAEYPAIRAEIDSQCAALTEKN